MIKFLSIPFFILIFGSGSQSEAYKISENSLFSNSISADEVKFRSDLKSSSFSIAGTSTLHDWESDVEEFTVTALKNGNSISADVVVQVKSIKSGRQIMDDNTYEALNEEKYPTIEMYARDLNIVDDNKIKGEARLTIAGKTKNIYLDLNMTSWYKESITVIGEIPVKMTDYGVEPPEALFGTVKTGNDIKIKFDVTLISE